MLDSASAGFGLSLIAAGVWLIESSLWRTETVAEPSLPAPLTSDQQELPVLSAAQLFEQTGTLGMLATIEAKLGFSREHFQRSVPPVLHAYAEFVQQLPVAESQRYAQPGGLLIRALEVVDLAVTFRRGQILPGGAAPEDIMQLEHRWTYAVLLAALLHDSGKLIADLRVTLYGPALAVPKIWTPLTGSMQECGAVRYRGDFASKGERDDQLHNKLPVFLFQQWVPVDVFRWLSTDRDLVSELRATLFGEQACGSGAIKELVMRAVAESVKRDLLPGSRDDSTRAGEIDQSAKPDSTDDRVHVKVAVAVIEDTASISGNGAGVDPANGFRPDAQEYLDDTEELTDDAKSKSAVNQIKSTAPKPQLLPPVVPALPVSSRSGSKDANATPEAALRFMSWLQAGLADGTLTFNQAGAMVHFVREGMLLVSPRIFQRFAKAFGEDGRGAVSSASQEKKDLGMGIQRQWLKAGWHIRGEKGINILPYQVLRGEKPAARISGVVIADPQRFVNPVPPPNPHVVKVPDSVEGVREHGLSA